MTVLQKDGPKTRRARGRPKLDDVAELENKLLGVALKEFLRHGYGGASLTRIIRTAGVSKTTLYSRYASKEQLFRAILHPHIERLPTAAFGATGQKLDLEAGLKAFANYALGISLKGDLLEVNRLIFAESHRFPELGRAAADRMRLGILHVAEFIREATARSGRPARDPEAVAEAFVLMTRGWYVNVMLTKRRIPGAQREQWVERAVKVLLAGRRDW